MFNNLENLRGTTHLGPDGGYGYGLQNLRDKVFVPSPFPTIDYKNNLVNLRGSTNIGTGGKGYGSSNTALQNLRGPGYVNVPKGIRGGRLQNLDNMYDQNYDISHGGPAYSSYYLI